MVIKYMGRGPVFGSGGIFRCLDAESSLLVDFLFIELFGIASRYCPFRNGICLMFS
jgi:hypothetical protein